MNIPYVKVYQNRRLTNPINGSYISRGPNRRTRRKEMKRLGVFKNTHKP